MTQQLQAQIHAPDDVRLDSVVLPEPGPHDAVVRVAACGICGSDVGYLKLGGMMGPTGTPMPIGHEFSGTVEAVGREVQGVLRWLTELRLSDAETQLPCADAIIAFVARLQKPF